MTDLWHLLTAKIELSTMKDKLIESMGGLPFFLMVRGQHGKVKIQLNTNRIIEGVIIGVVVSVASAVLTTYALMSKLETKIDSTTLQVQRIENYIIDHLRDEANRSNSTQQPEVRRK